MKTQALLCGILIVVVGVGCGNKDKDKDGDKAGGAAAGGLASCNTKVGECSEYNAGNRALGDDHLRKLCDNFEGTFATTGCPSAGRTGACKKDEGTKVYYQGYPMAAADLERSCTETAGRWMKP